MGRPVAVTNGQQVFEYDDLPVVVTVDGGDSTDPDGDAITAYEWSFLSKPPGSAAALADATAESTTFTADVVGSYVLMLKVTAGGEDSVTEILAGEDDDGAHDGAPASAYATVIVTTEHRALTKPGRYQREWHERLNTNFDALDALAGDFDAHAADPGAHGEDLSVSQAAHGFSVGAPIRCTGADTYAAAAADSGGNAAVVGYVTEVVSANAFKYAPAGRVIAGLAGLTAGATYFLQGDGTVATSRDADDYDAPLYVAINATTAIAITQRPLKGLSGNGGTALAGVHNSLSGRDAAGAHDADAIAADSSGLDNSDSDDVQAVLDDLDGAITAAAAGNGETNTASNVGAGAGVFKDKSGVDLRFKTLVEGDNVTLTEGADTVTIAAAGGGGGGSATYDAGYLATETIGYAGNQKLGDTSNEGRTWTILAGSAMNVGNGTWTAPAAGRYLVTLRVASQGSANILVNGTDEYGDQDPWVSTFAMVLDLDADDTVELFSFHDAVFTEGETGEGIETFFSITGLPTVGAGIDADLVTVDPSGIAASDATDAQAVLEDLDDEIAGKVTKGGDSDGATLVIGTGDDENVEIQRNGTAYARVTTSAVDILRAAVLREALYVVPVAPSDAANPYPLGSTDTVIYMATDKDSFAIQLPDAASVLGRMLFVTFKNTHGSLSRTMGFTLADASDQIGNAGAGNPVSTAIAAGALYHYIIAAVGSNQWVVFALGAG